MQLQDGKIFSWHNLPALVVDDQIALFSNVEGKLKVIELEKSELNDENIYQYAMKNKLFDCLTNSVAETGDEITLVITLTRGCNSLCRYCFLSANTHGKTMTEEMVYSAIDKAFSLSEGKKLVISFLGGEPTYQSELLKSAVIYAEQHSLRSAVKELRFVITTNGVFSEQLADFFIGHHFKISISADGIPEVQNFHRPLSNGAESSCIVEQNIAKLAKVLPL